MKKCKKFLLITLFIGLSITIVGIIFCFISGSSAFGSLLWNGESIGVFPDLFESIRDASRRDPYEGKSIYPAFAYLVCYLISRITPGDIKVWATFSMSSNGVAVGFMFLFICSAAIFFLTKKYLGDQIEQKLLLLLFFTSPGYLYCVERCNMVLLALVFIIIFITGYDSENKVIKEISLISLAFAACLKIYPVLFGLLLLQKDRIRDAIKCIIYGLLVFILPFFSMGGISKIPVMISNILSLSLETVQDSRNFGFGYKINIANMSNAFFEWLGIPSNIYLQISERLNIMLIVIALVIFIFAKKKWEKIWAITLILTLLPGFSWIYNAVYFLVPFIVYIKEENIYSKWMIGINIGMILILAIFPYGYIATSLPGVNKLSISTIAVFIGAIIITASIYFRMLMDSKQAET